MIVITAPTGNIGHQVLDHLLATDRPVRVVVRDPARLPAAVRDRADIVVGSHGDPDVVARAFAGADTVFWLLPGDRRAADSMAAYVDFTRPAAEAIRAQGVRRVVSVSTLGRGAAVADRAGHITASLAMDDLIAGTGVMFRALANASFMENVLRQTSSIRQRGTFSDVVAPDRKLPRVATRDIAAVAARLLLDDTWTGQAEIPLLGPEDLSADDMAAIMSDVLGFPVKYERMPHDVFRDGMLRAGASDGMAQGVLDMMTAADDGIYDAVTRTAGHAADTPTTFRQWCEEVLRPAV